MYNKPKYYCFIFFFYSILFLLSANVQAQVDSSLMLSEKMEIYQNEYYKERLFVHTDKTFYVSGENVWMKFYLTDALLHKPSNISKLVYVELINKNNQTVIRTKIELDGGFGDGYFNIPNVILSGNYTLRAYTQWMRNEGLNSFFEQTLTIVNTINDVAKSSNFPIISHFDFQFFPEGGNIVEGIDNKIAFKVVDEFEHGINCKGIILNERNDTITKFTSFKMGMGNFSFKPKKGEHYRALVKIGDSTLSNVLPETLTIGYSMHLLDTNTDSLYINIYKVGGNQMEQVYLLMHGAQFSGKSAFRTLINGQALFSLSKKDLKDGVNKITIFNSSLKPVCERSFFNFPKHRLSIILNPNKDIFEKRSEVQLKINTNSDFTEKQVANLSMSVFLMDSVQAPYTIQDIESYLLLTNEVNGYVESPSSYFDSTKMANNEKSIAIDNLMLTQGWSSYNWQAILGKAQPILHLPEIEGPLVRAKITTKNGDLPAKQVLTYFTVPGNPFYFTTAKSNQNGELLFNLRTDLGANEAILQAVKNGDTSYRISIIDPYEAKLIPKNIVPFSLRMGFKSDLLKRSIAAQAENIFDKSLAKEPSQKSIQDSLAFFGKPSNSYFLDAYTRFTSMEELTREYVQEVKVKNKGVDFSIVLWNNKFQMFNEGPPLILMDGVPIFDVNKLFAFDPLKIKKIDILAQTNLTGPLFSNGIISYSTYNGDLANFPIDEHALLVEYRGAQASKKFYSPQYPNKQSQNSSLPDLRNVLLWEPTIYINNANEKQINFFSSDLPGKYAVVVQGVSNNGFLGSCIKYITVK